MFDTEKQKIIFDVLAKLDRALDLFTDHPASMADIQNHRAFLWDGKRKALVPVKRPVNISPDSLLGIDENKSLVMENTAHFISGQKANNILLWGERGTGKSSLIKCLLSAFTGTSLRMIQVLKPDILSIRQVFDTAADNPGYRFILFLDDFSFEENQGEYREMKTIMDGGLEQIPGNLLFYATSNHKHLIPTKFSDMDSDDIRPGDTMEEKISLADRFGIRLGFYHFSQEAYLSIVDLYAGEYGISAPEAELHAKALQWSMDAGGRNGRIAEQFARAFRYGL